MMQFRTPQMTSSYVKNEVVNPKFDVCNPNDAVQNPENDVPLRQKWRYEPQIWRL